MKLLTVRELGLQRTLEKEKSKVKLVILIFYLLNKRILVRKSYFSINYSSLDILKIILRIYAGYK